MSIGAALESWFAAALTASVELPDGWFGRPYDNMHRLTWLDERDGKLFVELDGQLHLILADPDVEKIGAGEFGLVCSHAVLDWREYGSSGVRNARVIPGGRVSFYAFGS